MRVLKKPSPLTSDTVDHGFTHDSDYRGQQRQVSNSFLTAMLGMLTGKGIGFCIVHRLAKRAPENTYLLAARSGKAGEEAIQQLRDLGVTADLEALEMDVTRDDQIQSAAEAARAQFGKIDGPSFSVPPSYFHTKSRGP